MRSQDSSAANLGGDAARNSAKVELISIADLS